MSALFKELSKVAIERADLQRENAELCEEVEHLRQKLADAEIIREADRSLVVAVDCAMRYATEELGEDRLSPTTLTCALIAESLIAQGYPARLAGPMSKWQEKE